MKHDEQIDNSKWLMAPCVSLIWDKSNNGKQTTGLYLNMVKNFLRFSVHIWKRIIRVKIKQDERHGKSETER